MSTAPDPSSATHPALPLQPGAKPARPLRTCIASFDFVGPVKNGGVGTAFTSLGEALAAAGHEVTFLFLAGRWCENRTLEYWIEDYRKKGIRFVPMPESGLRFEAAWHISKAYEAYLWLKEQNFDVIHFSEWKGPGYFSLLAKHQGLAFQQSLLCVHTHGPTLWHKLSNGEYVNQVDDVQMDYLERRSVELAETLVSPSQYLLRWMLDRGWKLPEKSFVQPYVRPATARKPRADADRCHAIKELVFFGRLEVRKGLVLFCDALDQLKDDPKLRHASITFLGKADKIGNRPSADYLAQRAKAWPWKWQLISDRDQAGAMDYLQGDGRLAVLPSLVDNLPNTVLECLGAKVPFVASNAGGIPEMIAPADLDATCFPLRARAFADKLRHALLDGIRPATPAWDSQANERAWVEWHESRLALQQTQLPAVSLDLAGSNPLVSVCVSHWNRPDYLKQALASIEALDYPNFEVVLVDDGSTQPDALKLIEALTPDFARRGWQLIRNSENRYPGAARNLAARHARGEFIMFMDDDNCARPHELSTFVKVARRTGADILTCCLDTFSGTAAPRDGMKPRSRWLFTGDDAASGAFRNCFGDTNSLIRREVFLGLGGFHEDWGVGHEDWEFFAKAVLRGHTLEVIPEALAWYRLNETEQTVNRKTPLHRNHLANIRPYLEAVPDALKNLIYLAQGQDLLLAQGGRAQTDAETKLAIAWQSKVEAARVLAKRKQTAPAADLLMDAVKLVEGSKHPIMLFETLVVAGQEMRNLDSRRANQLFQLAIQLAKALKNDSMEQAVVKVMASTPTRTTTSTPAESKRTPPVQSAEPPRTGAAFGVPPSGGPRALPPDGGTPNPTAAPQVSIVIPVFNNLALTRSCLESLAAAPAGSASELILVDNASSDGTAEFLREHEAAGRLRVITNSCNEGFARGCNLGARAARGSLLLFLNNDTRVTPGWLDALLDAAQKPGVGVVGARLLYADGRIQHAGIEFINGVPDHPHRHAPADAPEVNQFRELDMVTGACLLIQRSLFFQLAGFDEAYRNGVEDVDLCLRARAAGRKVVYEPRAVVYHLEGQSAGRFDHVSDNLKLFLNRWSRSFDGRMRFIERQPVRVLPASSSVLLAPKPAPAAEPPVAVAWEGSFLDFGSLSHVNRELTRQLAGNSRVQLKCISNRPPANSPAAGAAFKQLAGTLAAKAPADAAITVRHAWPPDWRKPARGALVVIQPWEFGSLPEDWVRKARDVDEFWVPSEFVRQCYLESGVPAAKVQVVPNGVDPEQFHPLAAPMPLATKKKFKFLFVGGTIGRKGPDVLLKAYLNSFTAADDVCLVIKDFGGQGVYSGQTIEAQIRAVQSQPNAPEILYLNDELAPDALPGLYTACDCFVLPYRGEGFGLPVLEAMACGRPVIVTAGGATDDFVCDDFAFRIPAERRVFGREVSGMKLVADGWLLEPDPAALAERLKWAAANPEALREKGRAAAEHAQSHCTWSRAAEIAAGRIQALARKFPRPIETPAVSSRRREEADLRTPAAHPPPHVGGYKPAACARLGNLDDARTKFGRREWAAAWETTLTALSLRPFHPEAFLLLAEIALAAGDSAGARQCAQRARDLAPGWKAPKQFLQKPLKGNARPDWLRLPEAIATRQSPLATRLTVCVIAKNEEQFLDQCLKSVKGLAQQLIVVDTGSTDRTVEIARANGAEVFHFDWCDDFSAARNAGLEHATGDWILMLDADEELPADQHARLQADMKQTAAMAHRLPLANAGKEDGFSYVPRLFRNAPGVFYHGRIHEQVFPSLMPFCKAWGLETRLGTAQLLHHGYSQEMVKDRNKIERNLRLLRQAVEEQPGDPNLLLNLGLELIRSGELNEGLDQYREAFRRMSAQTPADVVPELREVLLTQFTCHLYKVREHDEVLRVLGSPLAKNGGLTASLHFALGLAHYELKQYKEAAEQMRRCVAKRKERALSPINTDILTAAPNHCLALSLAQLNDTAGAEKAFEAALKEKGRVDEIQLDYAKFLARRNPVDALHQLHEMIAQNSQQTAAWRLGGEIALRKPEFLEFACDWTGEAIRFVPDDPAIIEQRAEALLLSQQTASAKPLWERTCNGERPPQALAALILCAAVESQPVPETRNPAEETAASRAFVEWYQRLLSNGAQETIVRLNARIDAFRPSLPTAARLLDSAMAEVEKQPA